MDLRTLKHRQSARTLERARVWAPDRFDVTYDEYWDDDESPERDTTCKHCSGTGGDPWNDGITPCEHCDGEGYEWWN
ncbi:MAG: hypothetical protein RJA36_1130 [Pseudomonadota bacterium]